MTFASVSFIVFLAGVYASHWSLHPRWRNLLLLVSSWCFYALWDWRFVGLLALTTVVDYWVGSSLSSTEAACRRRALLGLSLGLNLGVLAFFKYFGFFAESLAALADLAGFGVSATTLRVALPVGISFYTFRSLSYTIDIYRGEIKPARSLLDYAVFVSFFPLLGAGPIVRARHFLPQLAKRHPFRVSDLEAGLSRFVLGLCKKTLIADTLGMYLVDPVFARPDAYTASVLWLSLVAYSIQIYADFSGYSSMAIGVSRMLGFKIGENFRFPYLARNLSDFWRRWHISLTSWFRDYLWWSIGRRVPFSATVRWSAVLVFVFLASGLWHGAAWTFVAWGGLHGVGLALNQRWRGWRERQGAGGSRLAAAVSFSATQLLVMLAWLIFRAPDFQGAYTYLRGLFGRGGYEGFTVMPVVVLAFAAFAVDHVAGFVAETRHGWVTAVPAPARGLAYAGLLVLLWHATPDHATQFIYFQF